MIFYMLEAYEKISRDVYWRTYTTDNRKATHFEKTVPSISGISPNDSFEFEVDGVEQKILPVIRNDAIREHIDKYMDEKYELPR